MLRAYRVLIGVRLLRAVASDGVAAHSDLGSRHGAGRRLAGSAVASPFDIFYVRFDGEIFVTVIGELDVSTVPQLRAVWSEVAAKSETVTLDLTRLEFIDSSGIRALLLTYRESQRAGLDLYLTRSGEKVMGALQLMDVVNELPFIGPS
jgi:anti-sigma B factor antagonist